MENYACASRRLSKTFSSAHMSLCRRRASVTILHRRPSISGNTTFLHLLANTALLTTDVLEGASILASIKSPDKPKRAAHTPRKSSLCFGRATPSLSYSHSFNRLARKKSLSIPRVAHPAKATIELTLSSHNPRSPPRKRAALDSTIESAKDIRRKTVLCADNAIVAGSVQPRKVTCKGCRETRQLENRGKYYPHNWWKHKAKCAGLREMWRRGELSEEDWQYRG